MKYFITLVVSLLFIPNLYAQNKQVTYAGDHSSFVIIKGDSVRYRLTNKGGLISYIIGKGVLIKTDDNQRSLIPNTDRDLVNQSCKVNIVPREDAKTMMSFKLKDGQEVVFATVEFTYPLEDGQLDGNTEIKTITYEIPFNGIFEIAQGDVEKMKDKEVKIKLDQIGHYFDKSISFKGGYSYEFIHCQPRCSYNSFIANRPLTFTSEEGKMKVLDSEGELRNELVKQEEHIPFNDSIFWTEKYCVDYNRKAKNKQLLKQKIDTIVSTHNALKTNLSLANQEHYFKAFPDNFNTFNRIFGFDDDKGAHPLYYDAHDYVNSFFGLDAIDQKVFFTKCIRIALGGRWDADAIFYFQHNLKQQVEKNLNTFATLLAKMNETEIYSFWFFYFDGPVPLKEMPKSLHPLKDINKEMYQQAERALKQVQEGWKNY